VVLIYRQHFQGINIEALLQCILLKRSFQYSGLIKL